MKKLFLIVCLAAASPAFSAESSMGYVVKVESATVFLDLGQSAGAQPGQEFIVYTEGPSLKHPVTGEILGKEEIRLAQGVIDQVYDKYSTGHLTNHPSEPIAAGQHAKFAPKLAPPVETQTSAPVNRAPVSTAEGGVREPIFRSQPVNLEAVDMAVGDIDGDGKPEIIFADQTRVEAYPTDMPTQGGGAWKPTCEFENKSTGARILSLEAADLEKSGKAKVFVTVYNSFFNHVETNVLECANHKFENTVTLPWATRSYTDETGQPQLASQELMGDMTFPFGNIYPLEFKDGKYVHGSSAIRYKRLEWLYGFGLAKTSDTNEPFGLWYTNTNRIRAQFPKGAWLSHDDYGQTSNRIRWYERPLMFYPRLILTASTNGLTGAYTIKNIPALGGLAGAWGIYNSGEIHRLRWTGLSLEEDWRGDLGGYAADIALLPADATHQSELLVAVVSGSGRTSILKYKP